MNDAGENVSVEPSQPKPDAPTTASTAQPAQPAQPSQQPAPPQFYLMAILPFAVFALVLLIRALPWSEKQLNRKPLSCDACVMFWCSIVLGFGLSWFASVHWSWTLLHMLPAPGVTLLLLAVYKWLTAPRELPLLPFDNEYPSRKRK